MSFFAVMQTSEFDLWWCLKTANSLNVKSVIIFYRVHSDFPSAAIRNGKHTRNMGSVYHAYDNIINVWKLKSAGTPSKEFMLIY